MDKPQIEKILSLLETIGQGLEHLQTHEDETVRQAVLAGRKAVTAEIESALGRSLTQQINANALNDGEWLGAIYRIVEQLADPFVPQNTYDQEFMNLISQLWQTNEAALLQGMKQVLHQWKQSVKGVDAWNAFVEYFEKYPLWGTLYPERGDFDTLQRRAAVLKRHSYDFLWLYRRLEDYLSKRTLAAILINWAVLNIDALLKVNSIFPDYWEPDLFPTNRDDVLVDVGAYTGDSIAQYVQMYGKEYKRIYAYEISPESCAAIRDTVKKQGLHDVVICNKGAGSAPGELFLSQSTDASANQLSAEETSGQRIRVVPLDDDLPEPVTFLKMDIEGAEWDTLLGCQRIIAEEHPKLAICVYHGYDDLWRIPALIDSIYPNYEFYLRHYGGNLNPTEFVLLCRPRS
ncbi:MAG: FkbM family methyltransferase [Angelakisella sp.]|jgi:FkbM family methyltransferase|nr:FkbM family methyltransferase [Angelakisella sp.]